MTTGRASSGGGDSVHEGTGLGATAERLRLLYGDAHTVAAGNRDGGGFRVTIVLPWREDAGAVAASEPTESAVDALAEMRHARAHR